VEENLYPFNPHIIGGFRRYIRFRHHTQQR